MSLSDPCLIRSRGPSGEPVLRLGMPLVDDYLEFLEGRCRPNTVMAAVRKQQRADLPRSARGRHVPIGAPIGTPEPAGCRARARRRPVDPVPRKPPALPTPA